MADVECIFFDFFLDMELPAAAIEPLFIPDDAPDVVPLGVLLWGVAPVGIDPLIELLPFWVAGPASAECGGVPGPACCCAMAGTEPESKAAAANA